MKIKYDVYSNRVIAFESCIDRARLLIQQDTSYWQFQFIFLFPVFTPEQSFFDTQNYAQAYSTHIWHGTTTITTTHEEQIIASKHTNDVVQQHKSIQWIGTAL